MAMVKNSALEKMRAGKLALGFGVYHLRSTATVMIAEATGHDWLFVDTEHGALTVHEASQICFAALATGITPIVRVCRGALDEGTRALDNGALGIVVPHVNTAADARRVVEAFRFPPKGHRSWGAPPAAYGYRGPDMGTAMAALNETIAVVVMIETPEAVANADQIAAVDGVDVLLFGTSDLTTEMGIAGQIGHQRVQDAYASVGAVCKKHGKFLGMGGVGDEQWASHYIRGGARFVLANADHGLLMHGAERTKFLRALET